MKNYIKLGQLSEKKADSLLEIQEGMQFVSVDDDNDLQMEVQDGESFMRFLFGDLHCADENRVKREIKEEPPSDNENNIQSGSGTIPQEDQLSLGQLSPANTASPQASPIAVQVSENQNPGNADLQQLNQNTVNAPLLTGGQNATLQNCLILFDKDGKGTLHNAGSNDEKIKIIELMQQQLLEQRAQETPVAQIQREAIPTHVPLAPPPIKQEVVEGMIKKKKPKKKNSKKSKQHQQQQHGPYGRPQNNTAGYWQNQPPPQRGVPEPFHRQYPVYPAYRNGFGRFFN